MKLIEKINAENYFLAGTSSVCIYNDKTIFFKEGSIVIDADYIFSESNRLFYKHNKQLFELDLLQFMAKDKGLSGVSFCFVNDLIIASDYDYKNKITFVKCYEKEVLVSTFSLEGIFSVRRSSHCVLMQNIDKKEISVFNLHDKELKNYKLSDINIYDKLTKLVVDSDSFVFQNSLICPVSEGGLIAIDIKSGDLKWHLFDLDRPYQGFVLNDAVCFIGEWFLIEIDLRQGEIMRKVDIRTLSFNSDFNIGLVKLYDNRIYFTDNRNKQIGILDYQTLRLIDLYQLEKQKDPLNLTKLDVVENRIYVLDKGTSSSTLYILEDNNGHLV